MSWIKSNSFSRLAGTSPEKILQRKTGAATTSQPTCLKPSLYCFKCCQTSLEASIIHLWGVPGITANFIGRRRRLRTNLWRSRGCSSVMHPIMGRCYKELQPSKRIKPGRQDARGIPVKCPDRNRSLKILHENRNMSSGHFWPAGGIKVFRNGVWSFNAKFTTSS